MLIRSFLFIIINYLIFNILELHELTKKNMLCAFLCYSRLINTLFRVSTVMFSCTTVHIFRTLCIQYHEIDHLYAHL